MNKYQRIILLATAAILVAMLLFPPFKSQYMQGITVNSGYSFILTPPTYNLTYNSFNSQVNLPLLGLQYIIIVTVGGLLCLALKSKES